MKKLSIILFALLITACESKNNPELAMLGIDNNKNGVRDDVDSFINKQNYTPKQKLAAYNMALVTQKALTVDLKNKADMKKLQNDVNYAVSCIMQLPMPDKIIDSNEPNIAVAIEKLTVNTETRQKIYAIYDATWDDTVYVPSNYTNACEHKIRE